MTTRGRRPAGFAAGVATAWCLAVAGGYAGGWALLAAGAALYGFLVWAIRGFAAPLWGLITGIAVPAILFAILWGQSSECAYEDAAGGTAMTECASR